MTHYFLVRESFRVVLNWGGSMNGFKLLDNIDRRRVIKLKPRKKGE